MKTSLSISLAVVLAAGLTLMTHPAQALELDWAGQFRAEMNMVKNYSLDSTDAGANTDLNRDNKDGYYIRGGGQSSANFQTLFLRLKPKLVLNDTVTFRSEWWLGDPVYGLFGNALPYTTDQLQFYSNQSRGSTITAQRFWADIISDFGTFQVGRAPLHWGLGIVWNSGDGLWDRYQSTGDVIRLVSKFGAFSFVPSFVSYSMGNNVGGSCTIAGAACNPGSGTGGVAEYSLMLKYENPDEDMEGGVNFVKRLAGASQDANAGYLGLNGKVAGMNYNIWDLYGHKRFGNWTVRGELPITTGDVGGFNYSTFALAGEVNWKTSDTWDLLARFGRAPGQTAGPTPDKMRVFYFHPAYRLGMIMFNYQLANFAGPNSLNNPGATAGQLKSPFDNPIVNANYLSLAGSYKTDKWNLHAGFTFANAIYSASTGELFYNTVLRRFSTIPAAKDQEKGLGWEMDYGATLQLDDYTQFGLDFGFYFPGAFYKFSNTAIDNATSMVFATVAKVGISF